MLLRQFPDINMVRRLRNDTAAPANRWMNVVLNIKCKEVSRTGVESPYSLFLNKKGFSYCAVNRRQYRIETDTFLLITPGEIYDLTIDNPHQTEICNIHINKDFFDGWAHCLTTDGEKQLDRHYEGCHEPFLFTQLYRRDNIIDRLTNNLTSQDMGSAAFEDILGDIVSNLLLTNDLVKKRVAALPFVKASVRKDIYRRLAVAKDYLHSNYDTALELDNICAETALSKFHFLRLFKAFYGVTPYQYLIRIRMEKASQLLQTTEQPIREIANGLGFEYPNSFIKSFQKTYGRSPLQYRRQISNFG